MNVAIRADASSKIGSGHVMRCLTLAKAFIERGHTVTLYSNIRGLDWLLDSITSIKLEFVSIDTNMLRASTILKRNYDLVVIDSYDIKTDDVNDLAERVPVLSIIDEPNPALRVHAILDQNIGAEDRYQNNIHDETLKMLGSQFALVREEISRIKLGAPKIVNNIENSNLLCFFGGSDSDYTVLKIAAIFGNRRRPNLTLVAPNDIHDRIVDLLGGTHLKVVSFTPNLPFLISEADTVICAAGTSAWDLATIGISTAFVCVADNQKNSFKEISSAEIGVCLDLNDSDEMNYEKIFELIESQKLREKLFMNSRDHFDGDGANRVYDALIRYLSDSKTEPKI